MTADKEGKNTINLKRIKKLKWKHEEITNII